MHNWIKAFQPFYNAEEYKPHQILPRDLDLKLPIEHAELVAAEMEKLGVSLYSSGKIDLEELFRIWNINAELNMKKNDIKAC